MLVCCVASLLLISGCSSNDNPQAPPAAQRADAQDTKGPLDGVERRLQRAGYSVEEDDSGGDGIKAALLVSAGPMTVHLTQYLDERAANRGVGELRTVEREQPEQLRVVRDFDRPRVVLWATIEEPGKLKPNRLLKVADLAINLSESDRALIETESARSPTPTGTGDHRPAPSPSDTFVEPSVGQDKDCGDFDSQEGAQEYFESNGGGPDTNVDRLDDDGDGVACDDTPREE
jgi:hypothetical protein